MRLTGSVAALSVAVLASACGSTEEPVNTTSPAEHATALAPAPQTYQRMRFVSPAEQSGATRAPLASTVRHAAHHAAAPARVETPVAVAADPLASLASTVTMASVTSSAAPEAAIVVALKVAPQPAGEPAPWSSEAISERRPYAVVMRGGPVGPEKCDPLSDMRARRAIAERGTMRAPVQGASGVFARGGRI